MKQLLKGCVLMVVCGVASIAGALELKPISEYSIGSGEGYSEIVKYSPKLKKAFVTSSEMQAVFIID